MLQNILIFFFLFLISFFPIVIWWYIFSYIDSNYINKKRFIVWITWWMLSVIPILYMDKILNVLDLKFLNIFYFISKIWSIFSSIELLISLSFFLIFIVIFSFFLWFFIQKMNNIFKIYLKNLLVFLILILIISFSLYFFNIILSQIDFSISEDIVFWDIIFNSFKLIIFYYLLIAFIEESSKYFNFLQSSVLHIKSIKTWVLYAIFVALWFSLIENILYLYNYYLQFWISIELLKIYFLRSIFSVIVHVLCSSVVAYYFSKALLLYRWKDLTFSYIKIFSYWIFISIFLHLLFDVALTLWFSFIVFLYFIGWYLYVSSIFYRE